MKKSTYTRTALASLLTLCSFGGFAAGFSDENIKEVKKQESTTTSGKMEVMKTSNKRLKEKMDRICNADPRKKAEELKKKEELAEKKKKEEIRLANEKKAKLAKDSKAKIQKVKDSNVKSPETKSSKTQNAKVEAKRDVKKNVKVVNQNIEEKGKASPVVSVGGVSIIDTNEGKSGLRITFGGVVDAQGYGKAGPSGEEYERYNVMAGKSVDYYSASREQIRGANPIFPEGIKNIGDYSDGMGMIADAILHLRAEGTNEDRGLLYGADVQFHVPVTEGKGASQGVYAARGRSAHIFLNSKYGDLKLGYQFGPEALMRLDATRIATVDGAADSDWFRKVNLEGSAASFPFYVTPRLYTESFSSESEKLSFRMAGKYNKGVMTTLPFRAAYYSPKYMGARFGISYSPRYESSLFSVSDKMDANPFKAEIDGITSAFVDASKLKFNKDHDFSDGKKYKSADDVIGVLVDFTPASNAVTKAEKETALSKVVSEILPAIDQATITVPAKYIEKYKVTTVPSGISAVVKPINGDEMKTELIGKVSDLDKEGGDKEKFITDLKKAVNDLLNEGATATNVSTAVKGAFLDKVVNKMLYDGTGSSAIRHVGPDYEHIVSAGASYEYDFDKYNVKVKASAVGEHGFAKKPNSAKYAYNEFVEYNDLMGVNLGVSADYKINEDQSAKFAASFAYLGKSGQPKGIEKLGATKYEKIDVGDTDDGKRVKGLKAQFEGDGKDTMYWTAGAGYQYENVYTSLTYFGSRMNDEDMLHDVALGVQYDLSPACSKSKFVPYAALHYFMTDEKQADSYKITKAESTDAAPSNQGVLFLTGVKFSF